MQPLINAGAVVAAAVVAGLVWRSTRDRLGRMAAGALSAFAAVMVGGAIGFSGQVGQAVLFRISDDYAWTEIQKSFDKSGFNFNIVFEADPRIEQEFKREAIALGRRYGNDREALGQAADKLGHSLYKKFIGLKAPHGSTASVIAWGQAQYDLLQKLAANTKEDCGSVVVGNFTPLGRLGPRIAPEMNRTFAAAATAYKTSDPRNRIPSEADMEPIWNEIFIGPGAPFSQQDLDEFSKIMNLPHARACELLLMMLKRVFLLPESQQAMVFRTMLYEAAQQ